MDAESESVDSNALDKAIHDIVSSSAVAAWRDANGLLNDEEFGFAFTSEEEIAESCGVELWEPLAEAWRAVRREARPATMQLAMSLVVEERGAQMKKHQE